MDAKYLKLEEELDRVPTLSDQIWDKLLTYYRDEMDLGYADRSQEDQLRKNTLVIKNALCCIEKHWAVLFRAEFPKIPKSDRNKKMLDSVFLEMIKDTERLKKNT